MKIFFSFLFLLIWASSLSGQLLLHISQSGEMVVSVKEPSHHLLIHPAHYQSPNQDTTRFHRNNFHYWSQDSQILDFKVFPPVNWGKKYTIRDSSGKNVRYSVSRTFTQWHNGPLMSKKYWVDARYRNDGRIQSAYLHPAPGESTDDSEIGEKPQKNRWRYKYGPFGLRKTKGVKYDRDAEGRLRFFSICMGNLKLSHEETYDWLDREMRNGTSHGLNPELGKFIGVKYREGRIREYIHFSSQSRINKVTLDYDTLGRMVRMVDFLEDEKQASTIVEVEYQGGSSKIRRLTMWDFATNWEYSIQAKQMWEYAYSQGELVSYKLYWWDPYKWDNAYYENMDNAALQEISK